MSNIQIIKPKDQAIGEFDSGKITEQKPIGFSGEGSQINRLGPLFYWAWGKASGPAGIDAHPHKGFEIFTYILSGEVFHEDSLGTESVVGTGGVQLMQTGSGMWHAEGMNGPGEGLQIWLEPYLDDAFKRPPHYSKYAHEDFPAVHDKGVTVKTILGTGSPMHLVTDAYMYDVNITAGATHTHALSSNRTLAGLAIRGKGGVIGRSETAFENKDFFIIQSEDSESITIRPKNQDLRIVLIEVPTEVDYPLYKKPR
ncbi:pirin family protein [Paenibacillus harenae]|uniref:pirin family protein n=1 Tax=Paenibacillus harenae TaxID=306543 RepID=UPI000420FB8E|nr:pirin family protein [Paenibacillus harenae]